jgi:OOP family OmpA-OmpF porin
LPVLSAVHRINLPLQKEHKVKKFVFAILLSSFVALPAIASETGLYVGAKLGTVNYGYGNISNNGQAGFGLLGGYTINRNFAVEVEYDNLGGFESYDGNIKGSSFGFSGVGILPLNQQFSLFGKLGIVSTTLKDTAKPGWIGDYTYNNTGMTIGFGGQYNASKALGIRLGFDAYPVGDAISTTSSAGMLYIGGVFMF